MLLKGSLDKDGERESTKGIKRGVYMQTPESSHREKKLKKWEKGLY